MSTERWVPEVEARFAAGKEELSSGAKRERGLAALSYPLMWVTGLFVLLTAGRECKYARWHAIQATGFGAAATMLALGLNALGLFVLQVLGSRLPIQETPWYSIAMLIAFMAVGFLGVFAVEAYRGRTLRIPVLAELADRYA